MFPTHTLDPDQGNLLEQTTDKQLFPYKCKYRQFTHHQNYISFIMYQYITPVPHTKLHYCFRYSTVKMITIGLVSVCLFNLYLYR